MPKETLSSHHISASVVVGYQDLIKYEKFLKISAALWPVV